MRKFRNLSSSGLQKKIRRSLRRPHIGHVVDEVGGHSCRFSKLFPSEMLCFRELRSEIWEAREDFCSFKESSCAERFWVSKLTITSPFFTWLPFVILSPAYLRATELPAPFLALYFCCTKNTRPPTFITRVLFHGSPLPFIETFYYMQT